MPGCIAHVKSDSLSSFSKSVSECWSRGLSLHPYFEDVDLTVLVVDYQASLIAIANMAREELLSRRLAR